MIRNGGIGVAILAMVLLAWLRARRGKRARDARTEILVEQLRSRRGGPRRCCRGRSSRPLRSPRWRPPSRLQRRDAAEIAALAERQPDEIATLLRGWLVERS